MPFITDCQWCGAAFEAQRTSAKFCTDAHRTRASESARELLASRDAFRVGVAELLARHALGGDPATLAALAADAAAFVPASTRRVA